MPATFAGRFLLEDAASEGEPTFVWRARELATQKIVALKFFPRAWVDDPGELASARELIAELRRLRHPGVVPTIDLVVGQPWAAFVSPWVAGPTLVQMRTARPKRMFEAAELRPWLRSFVAALEAAHAVGLAHGGLEPNVVIQHGAELRLLQVGVVDWLERAAERHDVRMRRGTDWSYRSPARRRGGPARAADDVYALGAVIYELLTASCPEPGSGWSGFSRPRGMQRQRRRTGQRGAEIPLAWERAVLRCLEPNERDRLGSVRDLRIRLELAAPDPASPPPVPRPATVPAPPRASTPARIPPAQKPRPPSSSPETVAPSVDAGTLWLRGLVSIVLLVTFSVGGLFVWKLVERHRQSLEPGFEFSPTAEPVPPATRADPTSPAAATTASLESHAEEPASDPTANVAAPVEPKATNANPVAPEKSPDTPTPVPESEPVASPAQPEAEPPVSIVAAREASPSPGPTTPASVIVPPETSGPATAALMPPTLPSPDGFPTPVSPAKPVASAAPDREATVASSVVTAETPAETSIPSPTTPPRNAETLPESPVRDQPVEVTGDTDARPMPEGIFELAGVDEPPRLITRIDPRVPARLLRPGGPQRVELIVVVDRNGAVASARVQTATDDALIGPTLEAVRGWHFQPATKGGQSVAVRVALPVVFPES